jgi:hypothetical protein
MNSGATYAEEYWHLLRSGCRNTLIYSHTPLNCDTNLGSLTLPRQRWRLCGITPPIPCAWFPARFLLTPHFCLAAPLPPQSRIATSTSTTHLFSLKCFFFVGRQFKTWTRDSQDGLLLARDKIWSSLMIFLLLACWCFGDAKLSVLELPKTTFSPKHHPSKLQNWTPGALVCSYVH